MSIDIGKYDKIKKKTIDKESQLAYIQVTKVERHGSPFLGHYDNQIILLSIQHIPHILGLNNLFYFIKTI